MKKFLLLGGLVISIFSLVVWMKNASQKTDVLSLQERVLLIKDGSTHSFLLDDKEFIFEVVNSNISRMRGLSGRDSIGSDGMLFAFEFVERHSIWMKEMEFDLDIIWLLNGRVVDITLGATAPKDISSTVGLEIYQPCLGVNQVLEVESGFVDRWGVEVGDELIVN